MSYSCLIGKAEADRAAALVDIYAQLEAMGWVKHDYQPYSGSCAPADVDIGAETITIVGHSFVNGQHVIYRKATGGTVIGGLTDLAYYFIVNVSGNVFKLSATQGGAAINLTSQGVGTHTFEEGYRVYTSIGELGDQPIAYVRVHAQVADQINFVGYYYWNNSTHVGLGIASGAASQITTVETGFYLWIWGDKTLAAFATQTGVTYYMVFAVFMKKLYSMQTTTTEAGAAGNNVQISVVDNSQFIAGKKYQIYGVAQEGRDWVTVEALPAGHVQIAVLLRNYGSGSIIGEHPSTFGCMQAIYAGYFMPVSPLLAVGTGTSSATDSPAYPIPVASVVPDRRAEEKYLLMPWIANASLTTEGYMDAGVLLCGLTGLANEDIFGVNQTDSGTSSGGNDDTHFNDTTKAWGVNALVDKILVIKAGVGAGQTRKISSNAATQIIPVTAFTTVPDATSTYAICDEAYRCFLATYYGWAIKEVV